MRKYHEFSFTKEYQGCFVLNEDSLRRIDEVVRDALGVKAQLEYEVNLESGISYKTKDINDIVREENSEKEKIRRTILRGKSDSYASPNYKHISVDFGLWSGNGVSFSISGGKRDWVSLTQNKLEERVSRIKRLYSPLGSFFLKGTLPMILSFLLAVIMVLIVIRFSKEFVLDYLSGLIVVFFIIGWILGSLIFRFVKWLFPDFLFEFGEQIKHAQHLSDVRKQMFWVILIGGVLSLATKYFLQ